MANIQASNITQNSFSVSWNFDIPSIVNQEIIISGGPYDKRMPIIQENIQPTGSKSVSNLEPGSEYIVKITTNTRDENGLTTTRIESLAIQTLAVANNSVDVAANQVPQTQKNNAGYWLLGIFTMLFLIIVTVIKRSREAVD